MSNKPQNLPFAQRRLHEEDRTRGSRVHHDPQQRSSAVCMPACEYRNKVRATNVAYGSNAAARRERYRQYSGVVAQKNQRAEGVVRAQAAAVRARPRHQQWRRCNNNAGIGSTHQHEKYMKGGMSLKRRCRQA